MANILTPCFRAENTELVSLSQTLSAPVIPMATWGRGSLFATDRFGGVWLNTDHVGSSSILRHAQGLFFFFVCLCVCVCVFFGTLFGGFAGSPKGQPPCSIWFCYLGEGYPENKAPISSSAFFSFQEAFEQPDSCPTDKL